MKREQEHYIDVNQLRVGLYIHLDLGWMDHPFTFSNFKIKDEKQISTIKQIGLKQLRYDPKRSDCTPLAAYVPPKPVEPAVIAEPAPVAEEISTEARQRQQRLQRLKELQAALDESEKKFLDATVTARQALRTLQTQPHAALASAQNLINSLVDSVLSESEIAVHAMNGNRTGDEHYVHPLNVATLALVLAKSLDMTEEDARLLGMAALFHDIGKSEIPDRILLKSEPLTKSEQAYLHQHSDIGARIAEQCGLPDKTVYLIRHHHEYADGSGYPGQLKEADTDLLARLLSLVNVYDNLCNPANPSQTMTPYEALAHMFAHQRSKFDESLLKRLIKSLGVYPPGSVVQLSSGMHAIVISVNPEKPLRPFVMVHDPASRRSEPLLVDLRDDPSISISLCLRPNQLPVDALHYLNPRKRISYFVDRDSARQQ